MKSKIMLVAMAFLMFVCGAAYGSWFTHTIVKVQKYLTVGTGTVAGNVTVSGPAANDLVVIRAASAQSGDLLDMQNSSGTTLAKFASTGALTSAGLSSTGAISGTTITATGLVKLKAATSDPCAVAGGPGTIFFNATASVMCYCDGSSQDLKVDGTSSACF